MSVHTIALFIFWVSAVVLFYTFTGYPIVMFVLARIFPRKVKNEAQAGPRDVTVIMAAHNEEQRIVARLQNLFASDYPADHLRIVIVSDGSTDGTVGKIHAFNDPRVELIVQPQRSGKAQCLNIAVAKTRSDLIVFADVRQRFAPDTISRLVSRFTDPEVGAVSGALEIERSGSAVGGGVDAYWRLEKFIRLMESRFDSSIGCTGAVYAIRRQLFQELPPDTLLDDVVIPMRIALQKTRVAFDPSAVAYDPQALEPDREKVRKQRTLAGNYQMLFRYLNWLLPWRNRLWWQLLSHKYLRLVAPFFMSLCFAANAVLLNLSFYNLLFAAQCVFYLCAMIGVSFSSIKWRVFAIPAGFVFLNAMAVSGFSHYLRGSYRQGSWPAAKS